MNFLIVGSGGAIGQAVVEALECEGYNCYLAGQSSTQVLGSEKNSESPDPAAKIQVDLADYESILNAVRTIRAKLPKLDGIVFASGIATGSIVQMTKHSSLTLLNQVNALGPIQMATGLASHLNFGASLVFISSVAATFAQRGNAPYGASKLLLERLVQGFATEVPKGSIRTHLLNLGPVQSEMFVSMSEKSATEMLERSVSPQNTTPRSVAKTVVFLMSDKSDALVSAKIEVDAGYW